MIFMKTSEKNYLFFNSFVTINIEGCRPDPLIQLRINVWITNKIEV